MKNLNTFDEFLNESVKSDKLAREISKSINRIDDSMSYADFARAVAHILIEDYGQHNFQPFIDELNKELKSAKI
jgi:uncharacterized protein YllA (UPF0747 family)